MRWLTAEGVGMLQSLGRGVEATELDHGRESGELLTIELRLILVGAFENTASHTA